MEEKVICDTNILIELSRNNVKVIQKLRYIGFENLAISAVTACEFLYGAHDKEEFLKIQKAMSAITILHISEAISHRSLALVEKYALSHKLALPDALIAATSLEYEFRLYTLNLKDFRFIEDLQLY